MAAAPALTGTPAGIPAAALNAAIVELTASKPKLKELQRYIERKNLRLSLQRQAGDLKKLEDEFEERCLAYVRQHGGKRRAKTVYGYRLSLEDEQIRVSWKNEYVRLTSIQAAAGLAAMQPTREVVVIQPPGPSSAAVAETPMQAKAA